MQVIRSRSPYFININEDNLVQATLEIFIYEGVKEEDRGDATYSVSSTPIKINEGVQWDISELIYSEINKNFSSSGSVWVDYRVIKSTRAGVIVDDIVSNSATLGYGYFEDGYNYGYNSGNLLSNNIIYKNDTEGFKVPVLTSKGGLVSFYKGSELIYSESFSESSLSNEIIKEVGLFDEDSYKARVLADGGVFKGSDCLSEFTYTYFYGDSVDNIEVSYSGEGAISYKVVNICESKYSPIKLFFLNKEGYKEGFWFFKRNDLSISSKKDEFMRNTVSSYSNGDYTQHQTTVFNANGVETIKMNSGWVDESFNETFRQMMLSEYVWIDYNDNILPVKLKKESLDYKTKLNNKLINYEISVEFSFNKINNIR